jgi:hypothetical protein
LIEGRIPLPLFLRELLDMAAWVMMFFIGLRIKLTANRRHIEYMSTAALIICLLLQLIFEMAV